MILAALLPLRRGMLRRVEQERGAAGIVAAVIVVPALLSLILVAVQIGLWYIANSAAQTAAEEGSRAMAGQHASQQDGCKAAQDFAERAGHNLFEVADISCTRTDQATVTVSGSALSLLAGVPVRVAQTASLPVERVS